MAGDITGESCQGRGFAWDGRGRVSLSPVSLAPCLYKPYPGPQEIITKPQGCCIFLNTTTSIDSHSLQISQDDVFVVILIKNLHSCGLLWRTAGRSQFNSIVLLKQLFHVSSRPRHGAQGAVSVAIIELETRRGDYPSPVVILRRQEYPSYLHCYHTVLPIFELLN